MLVIKFENNFISLAKVEQKGSVTVVATKLKSGLIEIVYMGNGIVRVIKSAGLLAARMISSLMGADYDEVNEALRGVV